MRVTGGTARGRRLKRAPAGVRPTHSRVRGCLFDIWGRRVEGARFADLYAGAGAVGIEALSRGAANVVFVEVSGGAARAILENAAALGFAERTAVARGDALRALRRLARSGSRFDLVFLDPPYARRELGERTLQALDAGDLVAAGGSVAWQHPRQQPAPERVGGLARVESRRFGETTLTFYRPSDPEARGPAPTCRGEEQR